MGQGEREVTHEADDHRDDAAEEWVFGTDVYGGQVPSASPVSDDGWCHQATRDADVDDCQEGPVGSGVSIESIRQTGGAAAHGGGCRRSPSPHAAAIATDDDAAVAAFAAAPLSCRAEGDHTNWPGPGLQRQLSCSLRDDAQHIYLHTTRTTRLSHTPSITYYIHLYDSN